MAGADRAGRVPWRWLAAGVLALALFAAWRTLPVEEWLRVFQAWVSRQGALGGILYGAFYVLAALLFVPGSALTVGAGLLFGLAWGTALVSVASTTAAAAAFLIARYLARERVENRVKKDERFGAIDRAIGEKGWKIVALLRLSPLVPFSLSNYLYGLTSIAFLPYVLTSWLAMLPATVLYVYLGAAGKAAVGAGKGGHTAAERVFFGVGLLATVAVTVLLTRIARRELEKTPLRSVSR